MEFEKIKEGLLKACEAYVKQRQATAKDAIAEAKAAAAEETKSSAGDKYETGRAMAQLAEERAQSQLTEANKLAEGLALVNRADAGPKADLGSLVITPQAQYYLAISLGKLTWDGTDYFVVSPASPIGQALKGARTGDKVSFQGRSLSITQVI
ncbi:MAG: 3-oxoacyl-ACP synthase [Bacteroidota bacterium]